MRLRFSALCVLAFVVCVPGAQAEPTNRKVGRLTDGRAYRTDAEGVRLVDHIAELEVSVGELQRQIYTLESEIIEKNKTIATMERGGNSAAGIDRKQSLPPPQNVSASSKSELEALQAKVANLQNELKLAMNQQSRCAQESSTLQQQINVLRQDVRAQTENKQAASQLAVKDQKILELHSLVQELQEGVSISRRELAQAEKTSLEKQQLSGELNSTKSKAQNLGEQLKLAQQQLEEERLRSSEAESTQQKLQSQMASLSAELAELRSQEGARRESERASLAAARLAKAQPAPKPEATGVTFEPSLSMSQSTQMRGTFQQQLQQIQKLVLDRKNLKDQQMARSHGLSVNIQTLVSRAGDSLDNLRVRVGKLENDPDEAERIASGLSDIQNILKEDIRLLSRLTRL